MSEFNKEVSEIRKTNIPINPNVHNLRNTMCFKTWNDIVISLPQKNVKWCCKTQYTKDQMKELTFDIDTLSLDFLINHPILQQRKYDLSGGTRTQDCIGCWKSEDAAGHSVRTEYNSNFEEVWVHRLKKSENHPKKSIQFHQEIQEHDGFRFIEIELTNKCNMACVYCWEGNSSRWQKETGKKMPDTEEALFDKTIEILNEYWDKDLHKKDYIEFSLLGGEPFFTEHMYKFIEDFVVNLNKKKNNQQQIVITLTTNLNFPKKKFNRFIELVEETPNIKYMMQLSGEAIGKKSEYIRWGLNWDNWDSNLDLFLIEGKRLDNLTIGFGCAHNSLSYPYFIEFLKYLNDKLTQYNFNKDIYMHTNWVDNPEYLSVRTLSKSFEKHADDIIEYFVNDFKHPVHNKQRYVEVLKTLKSHIIGDVSDETRIDAYNEFTKLEKRRNISFSSIFPHFSELIKIDK